MGQARDQFSKNWHPWKKGVERMQQYYSPFEPGGGGETLRIVKCYMHLGTQAAPTASPVPEWHARAQSSLLGAEALRKMLRSSTYLTPPTLTLASVPCHSR